MRAEAKLHKCLDHIGVIRFISFHEIIRSPREKESKDEADIQEAHRISHYILMEFAPSGDLFDFSIKLKSPLGESLSRHLFRQIVDALSYLHCNAKVVHRDLKLENILLDKNFQIKLCDFAMSKTLAEGSMTGIYYS